MTSNPSADSSRGARRVRRGVHVRGAVQGVGFRPAVFRLAARIGLVGWVENGIDGVRIEVEGEQAQVEDFLARLAAEPPRAAVIDSLVVGEVLPLRNEAAFVIRASGGGARSLLPIGPDLATCPACLAELLDPADRRHRYPFLNCTDCGPRYSILLDLPYDRPNTTMAGFPMCAACAAEYGDPHDRRFHAQPTACPDCGPRLELLDGRVGTASEPTGGGHQVLGEAALAGAVEALAAGELVAVQGIGGFHLMCDATNEAAVAELRRRKRRGAKPLAVMFPTMAAIEAVVHCGPTERAELLSPAAPILLLGRRAVGSDAAIDGPRSTAKNTATDHAPLAPSVAPGSPYLGCLLPYSPLHHLLLADLGRPLIATSGNLSDEPLCIAQDEARERLAGIADRFLVHDRPIARPVDDSVVLAAGGERILLRRARGFAPLALGLPTADIVGEVRPDVRLDPRPAVAVGAHEKNTIAWRVGDVVLVSPHIGDLDGAAGRDHQALILADLGRLLEVEPGTVVCDRHGDYASTILAEELAGARGLAPVRIQHHHAHALACLVDAGNGGRALAVTWDGTGAGDDGTVWGGELLAVDAAWPRHFERLAHLEPFALPGGASAVREPRRCALALLHLAEPDELFAALEHGAGPLASLPSVVAFEAAEARAMAGLLRAGRAVRTSSIGRLFDGVASLLGLPQVLAFEGEAAMQLEYLAREADPGAGSPWLLAPRRPDPSGAWVLPAADLIRALVRDLGAGRDRGELALGFHRTLAHWVGELADRFADRPDRAAPTDPAGPTGPRPVALTGGCFQNALLLSLCRTELATRGHGALIHRQLPPNDGSIAVGQALAAD